MKAPKRPPVDTGEETPRERRRWRRTKRALWVIGQILTLGLAGAAAGIAAKRGKGD